VRDMAKPAPPLRDSVLLVTVAVDGERWVSDSKRVVDLLKRAGYTARPTTHEVLRLVAEDPESLPQFREIGPPHDPPPAAA
jgi:hypothetical protein